MFFSSLCLISLLLNSSSLSEKGSKKKLCQRVPEQKAKPVMSSFAARERRQKRKMQNKNKNTATTKNN
jgi:hypothetical protein